MLKPVRLILKPRSIELEFDIPQTSELKDVNDSIEANPEEYKRFYRLTEGIVGENADIPESMDVTENLVGAAPAGTETDKPKRGRRPKNSPDPATAVAPPPLAIPSAPAPAAPAPTGEVATIAPPPPPVPAPAAPAPAAPPPVGVLAGKVVAELKRRGEGAADNGKALVDWLASAGLVVPGATFQEAIDCVSFLDDAKLGPVATGLGVAA